MRRSDILQQPGVLGVTLAAGSLAAADVSGAVWSSVCFLLPAPRSCCHLLSSNEVIGRPRTRGRLRAAPLFAMAEKLNQLCMLSDLWRMLMPWQCWLQMRRLAPPEQRQALDAAAIAAVGSVTAAAAYFMSQGSSA